MIDLRHRLYEILPTSTYRALSDNYHMFLQYTHTIRSHERYDADNIYSSVVIGLTLGVILVTFLEFFPGEPFSMELEKDKEKNNAANANSNNNSNNNSATAEDVGVGVGDSKDEHQRERRGKDADREKEEKILEKAQAKYGLSSKEIEELLLKTRGKNGCDSSSNGVDTSNGDGIEDTRLNDIEDDLELTLTQKLNLFVYGSFMVGLIYVLNRDYDSVVTLWFMKMFPREARTLGFQLPTQTQ